jgi:hypothetical protein
VGDLWAPRPAAGLAAFAAPGGAATGRVVTAPFLASGTVWRGGEAWLLVGGEWVCAESPKGTYWADPVLSPTRLSTALERELERWAGYRYGRAPDLPSGRWYTPWAATDTGSLQIDCSTWTWSVLASLYPDVAGTRADYQTYQMFARKDPWGPVTVAQHLGLAAPVAGPAGEGGWCLVQSWTDPRDLTRGGHSYFARTVGDRAQVLEAAPARGVGWRFGGRTRWGSAATPGLTTRWVRLRAP